eukprot:sb/3479037/
MSHSCRSPDWRGRLAVYRERASGTARHWPFISASRVYISMSHSCKHLWLIESMSHSCMHLWLIDSMSHSCMSHSCRSPDWRGRVSRERGEEGDGGG